MARAELKKKSDEEIKKELIDSFKHSYDSIRQKHYRRLKKNKSLVGLALAKERTEVVDNLISSVLTGYGFDDLKDVAVVGLGSYGRGELSPYSDIDLLILYKKNNKTVAKEVANCLLYFLWDLNLDIGHSVRTVRDCVELSYDKTDVTILSSLLDARFINGDLELYNKLDSEVYEEILPSISTDFIKRKLIEKEERLKKIGKTVYLLEPNVKEGEGGLRDIHTAIWVAQSNYKVKNLKGIMQNSFISEKEYRVMEKCLSFLLLVRSEIHYQTKRCENNICFGYQEKLANFFGYKDGELKAVEKFMRVYYLRASLVRQQSNKIIEKCIQKNRSSLATKTVHLDDGFTIRAGYLSVTSRNIFKEAPVNIIRAFEYCDKYGVKKSRFLISLLREIIPKIDEKIRRDREINKAFLRLLNTGNNVSKILFEMNDIRFLGHFIPEFGRIVCMVRYDAYHSYTVDIHSIFMVEEIEKLLHKESPKQFSLHTKVAETIVKRDVLYLACLFHDMGKGSGRNHARKGAAMIPKIAERMGLSDVDAKQLEFLVRHHIVMAHFSQRRDFHDPTFIERFAKSVKSLETLSLLFLLTFADIRSVGPGVWTSWKDMLLFELYVKTANVLELGKYREQTPKDRFKRISKDVVKLLKGDVKVKVIKDILKKMPDSYFNGFSPRSISYHIKIIDGVEGEMSTDIKYYPEEEYDEFTFWGVNEDGIFSKICGVLSANNLNILGARIVTTSDDKVLDILYVNRFGKSTVDEKGIWDKVRSDLEQVKKGKLNIGSLVEKKKRGSSSYKKDLPKDPTWIMFDNEASDSATIIDIHTHDRFGLLYEITNKFRRLGLSINTAKIVTRADRVVDAFYVVDGKGNKIEAPKKIEEVKKKLMEVIES